MISLSSTIKEQKHHAEREPAYQQIGTRYIDDPEKTLERLANPEPQKGETEETDMKGYTFLNVE